MGNLEDTDERLKEIVELTKLYDVYGALLSDHKKKIFEDYVLNNYSLGEIAGQVGLSRQGVRDVVRRCSKELELYEEKLGFVKKTDLLTHQIEKIRQLALSAGSGIPAMDENQKDLDEFLNEIDKVLNLV